MLALADLILVSKNLRDLKEIPYFKSRCFEYLDDLQNVSEHCLENHLTLGNNITRAITELLWIAYKYISGSTTKEIYYELEYALDLTLDDWNISKDRIIMTAYTDDPAGFHCWSINILSRIGTVIPDLGFKSKNTEIIHVALPRFYKHNFIFCVPMYHEMGHFIDNRMSISRRIALRAMRKERSLLNSIGLGTADTETISNHFAEYFSDIFAATYIGNTLAQYLEIAAQGKLDSTSHPATARRIEVINDFTACQSNPVVDYFQVMMSAMSMEPFELKYDASTLEPYYDNFRPIPLERPSQVHGLFKASWDYLTFQLSSPSGSYSSMSRTTIINLINDLSEKSIQNYSIIRKWKSARRK